MTIVAAVELYTKTRLKYMSLQLTLLIKTRIKNNIQEIKQRTPKKVYTHFDQMQLPEQTFTTTRKR